MVSKEQAVEIKRQKSDKFKNLQNKITNDLNVATEVVKKFDKEIIVSMFGSARIKPEHKFYQDTYKIAFDLVQKGYAICTGGGPGLMEAASKGAFESCAATGNQCSAKSLGLSIVLPHEQDSNPYLHENITFANFAQRKIVFSTVSDAYIITPGGYGTLDELFEVVTLVQCKIVPQKPICLYGREYWTKMIDFIRESLLEERMINPVDLDMLHIVDSPEEAVEFIHSHLKLGE